MNWSNHEQVHDATINYTDWTQSKLTTEVLRDFDANLPLSTLWQNIVRYEIPTFTSLTCFGDPSIANPLLLDTKLTTLYKNLGLDDGSPSYLAIGHAQTQCIADILDLHGIAAFRDKAGSDTYSAPTPSLCGERTNESMWRDGTDIEGLPDETPSTAAGIGVDGPTGDVTCVEPPL